MAMQAYLWFNKLDSLHQDVKIATFAKRQTINENAFGAQKTHCLFFCYFRKSIAVRLHIRCLLNKSQQTIKKLPDRIK
jgi:hypothetical protein